MSVRKSGAAPDRQLGGTDRPLRRVQSRQEPAALVVNAALVDPARDVGSGGHPPPVVGRVKLSWFGADARQGSRQGAGLVVGCQVVHHWQAAFPLSRGLHVERVH